MSVSNQPFEELIGGLERDGLATASKKLGYLFREVAWTTRSEFLGSFGTEMQKTKAAYRERMSDETRSAFSAAAVEVNRIWPELDFES